MTIKRNSLCSLCRSLPLQTSLEDGPIPHEFGSAGLRISQLGSAIDAGPMCGSELFMR